LPPTQQLHAVVVVVNSTPEVQNLQETESALFSSWYFPSMHVSQMTEVVFHSVPATHCLHVTEGAVFCSWNLPLAHGIQLLSVVLNAVALAQNLQLYSIDSANS
jgi:hypothetical protein